MFQLENRIWIFLLMLLPILVLFKFITPLYWNRIERMAFISFMILIILSYVFRKIKVVLSLKFSKKIKHKKIAVVLFLLLIIYALLTPESEKLYSYSFFVTIFIILSCFLQTLFEELIFRGILLNNYLKKNFSVKRSVIYSSIIFGAFHITGVLKSESIGAIFNQMFIAFLLGLFLATVFIYCRNIYFVGILHFMINISGYFSQNSLETNTPIFTLVNLEKFNLMEALSSFIGITLIYSPFLIAAIMLFTQIKKEKPLTRNLITEKPFYLFNTLVKNKL